MKKILIILSLTSFFLTQCEEETNDQVLNVYFWRSNRSSEKLYLYVDNVKKGSLPYQNTAPSCDDADLKEKTLFLSLKSGKYQLAAKDERGHNKITAILKIRISDHNTSISNSTEGKSESVKATTKEDCLIEELHY